MAKKIVKPMSENAQIIFNFLKKNHTQDFTAADVAEKTGLPKKTVDACFTSAIRNRQLGEREEVEIENEDGTHTTVKVLKLYDEALSYDPAIEHEVEVDD